MKVAYVTHSLESCWNHGNAHFVRGILTELQIRGHTVIALEPLEGWSRGNLLGDHGTDGLLAYREAYPGLTARFYRRTPDLLESLEGADLVIVHEWSEPWVVAAIGGLRKGGARFCLLFHDTHHRAVSDPSAIRHFDLDGYDGVLAFGEALAEVYRSWGWGTRSFVWHEAADTRVFHPPEAGSVREGFVWIGNWGDGERTEELEEYLLRPARAADVPLDIFGVRYPDEAQGLLAAYGARYRGWIPNALVPSRFARHLATVHVPRRFYVERLPGIPTIRVFEALACGVPLVCSPWRDAEALFRPGEDFLMARDGQEMEQHMRALAWDDGLRRSLARNGLDRILSKHTCAHRVDELFEIIDTISGVGLREEARA